MRDREALDVLGQLGLDASEIARWWVKASQRAHEHAGLGYPGRSGAAGGGGRGGGVSNPVLANVAGREVVDQADHDRLVGFRGDDVAREVAEAGERLERARLDVAWLVNYVYRYTREPAKGQAPPSCRLCAAAGFTSTVYAQERCRFCWDLWRKLGDDPAPELVRLHGNKERLSVSVIRRFHPDYDPNTNIDLEEAS